MSIENLKSELEKKKTKLHQWSISENLTERDESYIVSSGLEQSRSVSKNEVHLNIWTPKANGRLGFFSKNIKLDSSIGQVIDQMIEKADLASQEAWVLPQSDAPQEFSKSLYKPFTENLQKSAQNIVQDLQSAIRKESSAEFNSAEIFITTEKKKLHLSTGFTGTHKRTKIYGEVCFSAGDSENSNEFLVTRMAAHPEQMDFAELCEISASGANALIQAETIDSGTYQCMVDSEVIGQIFSDAISHLDAENRYYNMPFQEKGDDFIKSYGGDEFSLTLDPTFEFGLGSCAYSSESLEQTPKTYIEFNKVKDNLVSSQMGQYLNWQPTSIMGNLHIQAKGKHSREELLKTKPILEILQFSALFSSPRDLSFSSEIRLARLWEPGKEPRYVKGGNFSGQFKENCRNIIFTKDETFRNLNEEALEYPRAYKGPAYAVLNDVMVSS